MVLICPEPECSICVAVSRPRENLLEITLQQLLQFSQTLKRCSGDQAAVIAFEMCSIACCKQCNAPAFAGAACTDDGQIIAKRRIQHHLLGQRGLADL